MKNKCLTCSSGDIVKNNRVIPDWMKKSGNYSLLPNIIQQDKYNANK